MPSTQCDKESYRNIKKIESKYIDGKQGCHISQ